MDTFYIKGSEQGCQLTNYYMFCPLSFCTSQIKLLIQSHNSVKQMRKIITCVLTSALLFSQKFSYYATFKPLAKKKSERTDTVPDITFISSQGGMQQGFVCLIFMQDKIYILHRNELSSYEGTNYNENPLFKSGQIYSVVAATCDIFCLTFACALLDNRKQCFRTALWATLPNNSCHTTINVAALQV